MGKIRVFLVTLVCLVTAAKSTPLPQLTKEQRYQIGLDCLKQTQLERAVIDNVLKSETLAEDIKDNQKYKDFLVCSYKRQGYLSQDGATILWDNIFEFLKEYYAVNDLEIYLDQCRSIEGVGGELSLKTLDCILKGLKKLELQLHLDIHK